jgi:hypothetical protein
MMQVHITKKILSEIQRFLPTVIDSESIFLEIGSDRGEGSTQHLYDLSKKYGVQFHTVDISKDAYNKYGSYLQDAFWHHEQGSTWCESYSKIGKKISLLFLDNFDFLYGHLDIKDNALWNLDTSTAEGALKVKAVNQKKWYKEKGLDLNNNNSQVEHLKQVLYLLPYLKDDAVIVMDDTFIKDGVWYGKCGPAVVYLQTLGYKVCLHDGNSVLLLKDKEKL